MTDTHTDEKTSRQFGRQIDTCTDGQIDRLMGTQTIRQTYREKDRNSQTSTQIDI